MALLNFYGEELFYNNFIVRAELAQFRRSHCSFVDRRRMGGICGKGSNVSTSLGGQGASLIISLNGRQKSFNYNYLLY